MINYGKILFAAPPRTGTTWFMKASHVAGLQSPNAFKAYVHNLFPEDAFPKKAAANTSLRVSLVRNPVNWLVSYYTAIFPGTTTIEVVDELLTLPASDTFDEFAYHYVERMPGHITEIFKAYQANTCLRIEDSPWNFVELVDSIVPRPLSPNVVDRIRGLGRQNISKTLPPCSQRSRLLVEDADRETMDRYDY